MVHVLLATVIVVEVESVYDGSLTTSMRATCTHASASVTLSDFRVRSSIVKRLVMPNCATEKIAAKRTTEMMSTDMSATKPRRVFILVREVKVVAHRSNRYFVGVKGYFDVSRNICCGGAVYNDLLHSKVADGDARACNRNGSSPIL